MHRIPPHQEVLEDLSHFTPTLYDAIEAALAFVRDFFEKRKEKVDPYLAPGMVRYIMKQHLHAAGQDAEEEEEPIFELGTMIGNGLILVCGPYCIRILKADHGDLPVPGPSMARQAFYHQQLSFGFLGNKDAIRLNLVALWDVDREYHLKELRLACPRGGSTTKSSVEKHWICTIVHPITAVPDSPPVVDEPGVETDLPIEFLEDDEAEAKNQDD